MEKNYEKEKLKEIKNITQKRLKYVLSSLILILSVMFIFDINAKASKVELLL